MEEVVLGTVGFLGMTALAASLTAANVPSRATVAPVVAWGARVGIRHPILAAAVKRALRGAQKRLESPSCSAIFSDFRDANGHTLQQGLDALGTTGPEYLEQIHFRSGADVSRCQGETILAVTSPGSRVVWMCPVFGFQRDPRLAEAVLLHEALHSLGLGENPPSSREITARVMRRCSR